MCRKQKIFENWQMDQEKLGQSTYNTLGGVHYHSAVKTTWWKTNIKKRIELVSGKGKAGY